jgi:hypothetical protein
MSYTDSLVCPPWGVLPSIAAVILTALILIVAMYFTGQDHTIAAAPPLGA